MATNNGTSHLETWTVTRADMEALSDHLAARAISRLTVHEPEFQQKLLLAASLIRIMAVDHPEGLQVEIFTFKKTEGK
jgi:hypothetical protein